MFPRFRNSRVILATVVTVFFGCFLHASFHAFSSDVLLTISVIVFLHLFGITAMYSTLKNSTIAPSFLRFPRFCDRIEPGILEQFRVLA